MISMSGPLAKAAIGLLIVLTGACNCKSTSTLPEAAQARGAGFHELRPLDEAHGSEFKKAFDEAAALPRYVVALSPT